MKIHSSILAWRIPWTDEPSGLQSLGLQRVLCDWSDLAGAAWWFIAQIPRPQLVTVFYQRTGERFAPLLVPSGKERANLMHFPQSLAISHPCTPQGRLACLDWLMVRKQHGFTGVNIISSWAPGGLRLCTHSHQIVNIFKQLTWWEIFHILKTTQEMCIKYCYLGTSERR